MLLSLLLIILLFLLAGIAVLRASQLPGGLQIDSGTGIIHDVEPGLAFLAIIVLGGFMALAWFAAIKIATFPSRLAKSRRVMKTKTARQDLIEGIFAAQSGQVVLAGKLLDKAVSHAENDSLRYFLAARIAEIKSDWPDAERAWNQLTEQPGGRLAGLRGALAVAHARGDTHSVETYARKALELDAKTVWAFNTLFDTQIAAGDWPGAAMTLANHGKNIPVSAPCLRRRRAVVCTAHAVCLPESESGKILALLDEATNLAPEFSPAIWHMAYRLMCNEQYKAAQDILKKGWSARPHAALTQMARRIGFEMSPDTILKYLQTLIEANDNHRESLILRAEINMLQKNWPEAIKVLTRLAANQQTSSRLCLLLEQAFTGYGDTDEAKRWSRMATTAAHEVEWSDIDPEGIAFKYDQKDWLRLVYTFGDEERLVHPRHETGQSVLDVGRFIARQPQQIPKKALLEPTRLVAPLDYEIMQDSDDKNEPENEREPV